MLRSISAGVLIAIASYLYINADNKLVAAFIFPLALLTIIKNGDYLFTGKIGKLMPTKESVKFVLLVLCGNVVGAMVLIPFRKASYEPFVEAKISQDLLDGFAKAMVCGMLMNIAVTYKNDLLTVLCVSGFLIGKCEHSIADICYIMISWQFNLRSLAFIAVVILGNALGAILVENICIRGRK